MCRFEKTKSSPFRGGGCSLCSHGLRYYSTALEYPTPLISRKNKSDEEVKELRAASAGGKLDMEHNIERFLREFLGNFL